MNATSRKSQKLIPSKENQFFQIAKISSRKTQKSPIRKIKLPQKSSATRYQKGDVIHWQAEKNLTEQFQKRGETGHKCNPYDVIERPIRARRFQPDEGSVHNRSPASLVVCQLRNAEWKKQGKSVIMMIPTLQLKPRLTTVHSLLLIVIRPRKFNYGYPFQQCLNVWRSPLFRHETVRGFNKSSAYTLSKSASLKTLQCERH